MSRQTDKRASHGLDEESGPTVDEDNHARSQTRATPWFYASSQRHGALFIAKLRLPKLHEIMAIIRLPSARRQGR